MATEDILTILLLAGQPHLSLLRREPVTANVCASLDGLLLLALVRFQLPLHEAGLALRLLEGLAIAHSSLYITCIICVDIG